MVLNGSRNPSISLQYLQSPIFDQTPAERTCDCSAENDFVSSSKDRSWMTNTTDFPILSKECRDEVADRVEEGQIFGFS